MTTQNASARLFSALAKVLDNYEPSDGSKILGSEEEKEPNYNLGGEDAPIYPGEKDEGPFVGEDEPTAFGEEEKGVDTPPSPKTQHHEEQDEKNFIDNNK